MIVKHLRLTSIRGMKDNLNILNKLIRAEDIISISTNTEYKIEPHEGDNNWSCQIIIDNMEVFYKSKE